MFKTSSVQQTATFILFLLTDRNTDSLFTAYPVFPLKLHQGDTGTSSLKGVIKFQVGTPGILGLSCLHFLVPVQITPQLDEAMISAGLRKKEKYDSFQMNVFY